MKIKTKISISAEEKKANSVNFSLIKLTAGLLFLAVLLSQQSYAPTLLNPVKSPAGYGNLFSLPGALFGGFFLESFGHSAFLFPLYLILLKSKESGNFIQDIVCSFLLIMNMNILLALCLSLSPELLLRHTGILGFSAYSILITFPGIILSVLIVACFSYRLITKMSFDPLFFSLVSIITVSGYTFFRSLCQKTLGFSQQFFSQNINFIRVNKTKLKLLTPRLKSRISGFSLKTLEKAQVLNSDKGKKIFTRENKQGTKERVLHERITTKPKSDIVFESEKKVANKTKNNDSLLRQALRDYEKQYISNDEDLSVENIFSDLTDDEEIKS